MRHHIAVIFGWFAVAQAGAATRYVSAGSATPSAPYVTWGTAAQAIQDAIDVSIAGDVIWVSNGLYATGGSAAPGHVLTNRVTLTSAISVRSVNGPAVTVITGVGPSGPNAIRCAYLTNGAELAGFTLEQGHTRIGDGLCYTDNSGGGAFLHGGGTLSNCIVANCTANFGAGVFAISGRVLNCQVEYNTAVHPPAAGGGIYGVAGSLYQACLVQGNVASYGAGVFSDDSNAMYSCAIRNNTSQQNAGGLFGGRSIIQNCTISSNQALARGGGAYSWSGMNLRNSLVHTNRANDGGGIYLEQSGLLQNCTVADNTAAARAGGVSTWNYGEVEGSIVVENHAPANANYGHAAGPANFAYSCSTPLPAGTGNISGDPFFVEPPVGDYRLNPLSPCIGSGIIQAWMLDTVDLAGRPRIYVDKVDMGAYEWNPANTNVDTDFDDLPDWWEWQHFAHVTNTQPGADHDSDRMDAMDEWIAGTDPTDEGSYFQLETARRTGTQYVVTWPSVEGRLYTLYRLTNLVQQGSAVLLASGLSATPPFNLYTDQVQNARTVVYKLNVQLQ